MKILHYTDFHVANKNPGTRTDDYHAVCLKKLEWVYETASDKGCDRVVFTGDFHHEPTFCRYDSFDAIKQLLLRYGIITYCVAGEHDLVGHSFTFFDESPLRSLCRNVDNFRFVYDKIEDDGFVFWAKHKTVGVEGTFPVYNDVDSSKCNILLCHDLVGQKKILGKGSRMLMTSEHKLPFDLVCCGDLHDGFEPHKTDNTWWVNPGSLLRRTVKDINRKPKCYVIDIVKGCDPIVETVYYPDAARGEDIFCRKEKTKEVSRDGVIDVVKSLDAKKVVIRKFETLFNEYRELKQVEPDVVAIFNTMFENVKE